MFENFLQFLWSIDYPTTIVCAFIVFFIGRKKRRHFIIPILIGSIIIYFFSMFVALPPMKTIPNFEMFSYLLTPVVVFFMAHFSIDESRPIDSLFLTTCIIALQHIAYKVGLISLLIVDINLTTVPIYFAFNYISMIIIYVIVYFLFATRLSKGISVTSNLANLISFFLIILFSTLASYFVYPMYFLEFKNVMFYSLIFNIVDICLDVLVILYQYKSAISITKTEENNILSFMLEKDKERYELAKITVDEINIKYHDLTHALKEGHLVTEEENEIKETIRNYKAIINTSNRGLNIVVYESQLKCLNLKIELNVLIDGDPLTFMKSHHAYSLLSNILENAIESTSKIENVNKKRIELKIKRKNANTIISLINPVLEDIKIKDELPETSKANKKEHGYGLKSVKRIVDIYNGNINISCENNNFLIEIVIPNPID